MADCERKAFRIADLGLRKKSISDGVWRISEEMSRMVKDSQELSMLNVELKTRREKRKG